MPSGLAMTHVRVKMPSGSGFPSASMGFGLAPVVKLVTSGTLLSVSICARARLAARVMTLPEAVLRTLQYCIEATARTPMENIAMVISTSISVKPLLPAGWMPLFISNLIQTPSGCAVAGYGAIAADEQRHIAYGAWFLREAIAADPAMAEVARRRVLDLLPAVAESISPPSEDAWEVLGVESGTLAEFGLGALTRRLKLIGVELERG